MVELKANIFVVNTVIYLGFCECNLNSINEVVIEWNIELQMTWKIWLLNLRLKIETCMDLYV